MGSFYRKYRNRLQYQWLRYRLQKKIDELHYIALQNAADKFREQLLLTQIRSIQALIDDSPLQCPPISSPGHT